MKRKWQDPEYKKKKSEASKKRWQDPVYKKKVSEAIKKRWQDPVYRVSLSSFVFDAHIFSYTSIDLSFE